ncbi:hypothetical protein, partial [Xanthovirga aplysinae]|uniref:hypothetical protein n=1 Tax=Xanthovirga aplysinae TaxID=2529853 RepID=UPI001CA45FC9
RNLIPLHVADATYSYSPFAERELFIQESKNSKKKKSDPMGGIISILGKANTAAEVGAEVSGKYKVPGYVGNTLNGADLLNKAYNKDYSGVAFGALKW